MPRKNSKKSVKKKSVKNVSRTLEFNVNLENNPNGLVEPIAKAANDEEKLGKLLNGMTQNSFNDGVDTTIHNTAMLLNTQLENVLGNNPGLFDKKNLEKMLHYIIEPTFNQLNEMANNTNYNYNQFGGVVGEKQFNNNLKRGEQKGGFYPRMRVRTPMFMPRMRQSIIPRVSYNPRLIMPRTMIVPSYTIITHDKVRALMDRRDRDKFNNYLSHNHSFETNDRKKIKIQGYPEGVSDHEQIDHDGTNSAIERLGDNFYKVTIKGREIIVNGFNLYYADNAYNKSLWTYGVWRGTLERIKRNAVIRSKKFDTLKFINNKSVVGDVNYDDAPVNKGKKCSEGTSCGPILSVSESGYFKEGGDYRYHVMMLEHVIE